MLQNKKIIVAIDGFSSCGKSTMAKHLAKQIGYAYIDTGAMYRAVAFYCLQAEIMNKYWEIDEERLRKMIQAISIEFRPNVNGESETYLNGINVETAIRTLEAGTGASKVSQLRIVREAMVKQQHLMGEKKGVVMDGRDIGTVVFPQAELKIFLTARPEIRAQRRYDELIKKGENVTFEAVLQSTVDRDNSDMNRAESPMRKASDALLLDNSEMSIESQEVWLLAEFNKVIALL